MTEKQLIVVVEGTAALGPFWQSIQEDYLHKIIRSLCGFDATSQKYNNTSVELSLVVFNAHGPYSAFLVQRSGWTKDAELFISWLSNLLFIGGGFSDVAIAEGLAEALLMFFGSVAQPTKEGQKHCILVAASNPYALPTPIFLPQAEFHDKDGGEVQSENCFDAENVAKTFAQCSVSLSVISPKQLPKLRAIYDAGKCFSRSADPAIEAVKHPQFLVLLSESFAEARSALSRSVAPTSSPYPTSMASGNGSLLNPQSIPVGNISASAKENGVVSPAVPGTIFPQLPNHSASHVVTSFQTSSTAAVSQVALPISDGVQEFKNSVGGMPPSTRPSVPAANVSILNNLSQVRQAMSSSPLSGASSLGLQSGTSMAMHVSNMISCGMTSSPLPTAQSAFSSGQSNITSIPGAGPLTIVPQVSHNTMIGSFSSNKNMPEHGNQGIHVPPSTNVQGGGVTQMISGMSQSTANMVQSMPAIGNLSSGAQMGQNAPAISQSLVNGLGAVGISSDSGSMVPASGMPHHAQTSMQPSNAPSVSGANMSTAQQSGTTPTKYLKAWEGALSGRREGQPVFICKLEGYRSAEASEMLAADWPQTMQIVRLIPQDHMNNKQYSKADLLVFRALNEHGFLKQLQEKKLCAVIQLPSQTLLLSVSDKAHRLIGMLFPGDMVVFKPQMSSQQQQQLQYQQQQQQLHQLQLQQQQQQQQQQIMGIGMARQFVQGASRGSVLSQAQVASQGLPNMPGAGFLS